MRNWGQRISRVVSVVVGGVADRCWPKSICSCQDGARKEANPNRPIHSLGCWASSVEE